MLLFIAIAGAAMGYVVMALWNVLLPEILGVTTISFWQAVGLLVLSKLLFGFPMGGRHRGGGGGRWRKRWEERMANMSEEDRTKLRKHWSWNKHDACKSVDIEGNQQKTAD